MVFVFQILTTVISIPIAAKGALAVLKKLKGNMHAVVTKVLSLKIRNV